MDGSDRREDLSNLDQLVADGAGQAASRRQEHAVGDLSCTDGEGAEANPGKDKHVVGLTNLMDIATDSSIIFTKKSLILYGKHDDVVPRKPTCNWLRSLPETDSSQRTILIYKNGYHMLNRDLQAKKVLDDIAEWVMDVAENSDTKFSTDEYLNDQHNVYISLRKFCEVEAGTELRQNHIEVAK